VEDRIIKIEFVRSVDNNSNFFTKNANQESYEKHVKKSLGDIGEKYGTCMFQDRKGIGNIPYVHSTLGMFVSGYELVI
jgi:hypothetical protein